MVEMTIDIPVTMEKIKPSPHLSRRNSTGNFVITPIELKVLSRYLKASTGSCHDLCKYGHKHHSETKPTSLSSMRFSATQDNTRDVKTSANSERRYKKPVIAPKPKSETVVSREVIKSEILTSAKKEDLSSKQANEPRDVDLKPRLSQTNSLTRCLSRRHSDIIIRKDFTVMDMHPMGYSSSKNELRKEITMTSRVSKKTDSVPQTILTSPKPSLKTVSSKNPGNSKSPRKATKMRDQKSFPKVVPKKVRKAVPKQPIEESVPEKTLYVIEPNAEISSTTTSHSSSNSEEEVLPLEDENLKRDHQGNNAIQFSSSLSLPSGSIGKRGTDLTDTKVNNQIRPTRVGRVISDDRKCSPCKLKFSRGKEVHVCSENSSPKRLNFRQGKVLEENQNGKADNREKSLRRLVSDGELIGTTTQSVKVVLKHQDVEERKDSQSSFNNVIEETASKLIQTRKSKVKALVGAFENLISLHDTNSSEK